MHDRGDRVKPAGESRRRVAELGRHRPDARVCHTKTHTFRHMIPDANTVWGLLLKGAWQVYRHMYDIVRVARQGVAADG